MKINKLEEVNESTREFMSTRNRDMLVVWDKINELIEAHNNQEDYINKLSEALEKDLVDFRNDNIERDKKIDFIMNNTEIEWILEDVDCTIGKGKLYHCECGDTKPYMNNKEKFREELEEVLDDQFPKNNQEDITKPSDNHRGEALVLFAWAMTLFEKYNK